MNDNFYPSVTWAVPISNSNTPMLTHITRDQSFITWLVAMNSVTKVGRHRRERPAVMDDEDRLSPGFKQHCPELCVCISRQTDDISPSTFLSWCKVTNDWIFAFSATDGRACPVNISVELRNHLLIYLLLVHFYLEICIIITSPHGGYV